jgi:2-polyprenyl-3-methyl-5-hydroxy-6-metoxy-1,4-benzoquinol methylase
VIELGCFDGKLLDFLPAKPARYAGFDANWEGGLDMARIRWAHHPHYSFHHAVKASDLHLDDHDIFNLGVIMETLEHVPADAVDEYLAAVARHLDGYLFVTVPNEKGPVFLGKWLAKKVFGKDAERYTLSEVVAATLGRMHRVRRNEHKGFDYCKLVREVSVHFDIVSVTGHPLSFLPAALCFGIGIVARSRPPTSPLPAPPRRLQA